MWDELAPSVWWQSSVCAIQNRDEVGFESLNCLFSWVSTVHTCVDKLAVKVLCFDACNQVIGDFIVQSVEDGFDSCINEALAACVMALNQVVCTPALDWFCQDCIGVTVAEDEDAAVSLSALPWEHAR